MIRGSFVEYKDGMIHVSPIGKNATDQEKEEFEKFD